MVLYYRNRISGNGSSTSKYYYKDKLQTLTPLHGRGLFSDIFGFGISHHKPKQKNISQFVRNSL